VLLGLQRDSESLMDYIDSVMCLLLTLEVRILHRGPTFKKVGINLLKDVEELKLQWLTFNVKTFDSCGGWISEKFQSLSRIALWIYGGLLVVDNVPPFVEPEGRTVDQWYKEDYKK
jgi:hypothetical protein